MRKLLSFGKALVLGIVATILVAVGGCSHFRPTPPRSHIGAAFVNNGGSVFVPTWSGGTDMTSTLVSDAWRCGNWNSAAVQVEWPATGTPVGSFSYEGSTTSTSGADGTFRPITLTVDVQPTGAAGGDLVDFTTLPWTFLRVRYTPASGGTGALPVVTYFGKDRSAVN